MCLLEWLEEGSRGTKAPLCPSLVSSPGNVRTSRGRQKQLDHDLSSGALRQIKVRHLMRRDQGDLSSCSKSCFNTSTRTRLDCPAIPTEETFHPDFIILIKLGFHVIQREIQTSHTCRREKVEDWTLSTLKAETTHTALWNCLFPFQSCFAAFRETLTVNHHKTVRPRRAASGRGSGWSVETSAAHRLASSSTSDGTNINYTL